MLKGHPIIGLVQPEIPQNTGNIARLCAATGSRLCLIGPCGFSLNDKNLRRAGLDYWPFLDLEIHDSVTAFLRAYPGKKALYTKSARNLYTQCPQDAEILLFGQESVGLPQDLLAQFPEDQYRIPLYHPSVRSLNVANAVAISLYHRLTTLTSEGDTIHD